ARRRTNTVRPSIARSAAAAGRPVRDSSVPRDTPSSAARGARPARRSSGRGATPSSAARAAKRARRSSAARDTPNSVARAVAAWPLVVLSQATVPARELLDEGTRVAIQDVPRGTGDAVRVALAAANGDRGVAFIVYGDTPLLRPETLTRMRDLLRERDAPLALLAGEVGTNNAYGRIVRDEHGDVARVVETRLATTAEKQLPESNLGAYAADLDWLRAAVG